MNYAVITENDESKWKDQTGILYHFPSRYKNLLLSGTKIIYYKGGIRDKKYINNRLANEPHYFGIATIGEVYPNIDNKKEFFAVIEEFIPFNEALIFKNETNEYLEVVTKKNYWRDGVRFIDKLTYLKIVTLANYEVEQEGNILIPVLDKTKLPSIDLVHPQDSTNLFIEKKVVDEQGTINSNESSTKGNSLKNRFSKNAKIIGDRAEEVVLKLLEEQNMQNIVWVAKEREKPGYDIKCVNSEGNEMFIEVKGTSTNKFMNFIITQNEIKAAEKLQDSFYIFFVANCLSKNPKIQVVQNPFEKIQSKKWEASPISYNVMFK